MHAAGLGELVALSLSTDVSGLERYADDSAIIIHTEASPDTLGRLPYVKNCFEVVDSVPRRRDLAQAIDALVRRTAEWSLRRNRRPFRLMFSEDGQLVGVPPRLRSRLEQSVGRATGGRFTPRGGGDEYWVITRRDLDQALFCRRIPSAQRAKAPKGGLAPDLAQLIVNATSRRAQDTILDPFAGTGALIAARTSTPFREAICSDLGYADGSVELMPGLAGRRGVRKITDDARSLPSLADGTIDVVLTDPPWGEFVPEAAADGTLLAEALMSLRRVLRPRGQLSMLTSRRLVEPTLQHWQQTGFERRRSYDLLVNGHPATLLIGGRAGHATAAGR